MLKALFFALLVISGSSCGSYQPQQFEVNVPPPSIAEKADETAPIKDATVISVKKDGAIFLKNEKIGTLNETGKLEKELVKIFEARKKSGDKDATTVFVRAPREIKYGDIKSLTDKLKIIGAAPIGLQIDDLEN